MGGSGFGIASFTVAVERGWISRAEAILRDGKSTFFFGIK